MVNPMWPSFRLSLSELRNNMVLFRYDVFYIIDNHLHNSPAIFKLCLHSSSLFGSERFNLPLGHIGYDCYELPAYLNVEQMHFDIQFLKIMLFGDA